MQANAGSVAMTGWIELTLVRGDPADRREAADGGGNRDRDRQQGDDGQRAVGDGFLRAQQRDRER